MFRWLSRWFLRAFLALAAVTAAAYIVDSIVYFARGSPSSTVTVNKFMGIPLKGQKEEYDYLGTVDMPCAVALFPHNGEAPCWRLRRNPNQWENL
jgi:hypothetical protein